MPIQKKGRGQGIIVSEFLTPTGRLHSPASPSNSNSQFVTKYLECGNNNWWMREKLLDQVLNCSIPVFEAVYAGYQAVFFFDNTTNHSFFAPDSLRVNNMNYNPGGEQKLLRDGYFFDSKTGNWRSQSMVFGFDDSVPIAWCGKAKWLREILKE